MATTLRQIAKRSGYSLATVAYALQGHPRVARGTRELIERFAREMGYVPDRAAAILGKRRALTGRKGDGPVVARWHWTNPRSRSEMAWDEVMDRVLVGTAAALGYSYQRENLWGVRDWGQFVRAQAARGVVGVLLQESGEGVLPKEADLDRFAVVCVESSPARTHEGIHRVRMAFEDAFMRCCVKAVERGYRRIGLAPFSHEPPAEDDLRVKALLGSCRWRFPRRFAPGGPYLGGHSDAGRFVRWVREVKPDAVVCQHAGGYWWMKDAGVAIPGEMGFCAVYMNDEDGGRVAGMAGCRGELVEAALEMVGQMLVRGDRGRARVPVELLLHPEWRDGESLPER